MDKFKAFIVVPIYKRVTKINNIFFFILTVLETFKLLFYADFIS